MKIAVFCASSDQIAPVYREAAANVGKAIGEGNDELIYGGTNVGLMYEVARATRLSGGAVTGIIPECIRQRGVMASDVDRLIIAPDMKERKQLLRDQGDAFIALPGGWGTLEEITEVITLKQLGLHDKPIVFLNIAGFYNSFFDFVREIEHQGFVSASYRDLYEVTDEVGKAMAYIRNYTPEKRKSKYG